MGISHSNLANVLKQAAQNDAVLAELKKIVEANNYPQFLTAAAEVAITIGNIRLAETNDEASTVAFMVDGFKAALYQQSAPVGISYATNAPAVHNELIGKWTAVQAYISSKKHLLNASPVSGAGLSMGGGFGGGGVGVSLSPTTPTAQAGGVAISVASMPSALPGSQQPVAAFNVNDLLATPVAQPAQIVAAPPVQKTPKPQRKNIEQLTGDNMESFEEHNLFELDKVAMSPVVMNRSVAQYREVGNYTDGLVASLIDEGVHRYTNHNLIVTSEDRQRRYIIDHPELAPLCENGAALQQMVLSELEKARSSDDVEVAHASLAKCLKGFKTLVEASIAGGRALVTEEKVRLVEMNMVSAFIRNIMALLDLRLGRTILAMTNEGAEIPSFPPKKGIKWDVALSDVTYLMKEIYEGAASDNGMVNDADTFRLIFIGLIQALSTIQMTWDKRGVTVHNRVTTIWLPTDYPVDKGNSVCNLTLGTTQEAVQAIFDELMVNMPSSSVVLSLPSTAKLLCGAGDSTVIYYY